MPSVYPCRTVVTRNLRQSLAPVPSVPVYVYVSGTATLKSLYSDATGNPGTELPQPITTDVDGVASFFAEAGRIRIDAIIDSVTTQTVEEVIIDHSSIVLPVLGEVPTGAKNSSNLIFTTARAVYGELAVLYVNGFRWFRVPITATPSTSQFKVSGTTLTLGTAPALSDVIQVDYWPVPNE